MSVNPPDLLLATKLELQVHQDRHITWEMTSENVEDDTAVDITGAIIIFSVKSKVSDTSEIFSRTVGDGIVIDADQINNKGKFQLSLIPNNTNLMSPGKYQMEIKITLSGKENTSARGVLEILDVVAD